jgi:hypothetical protein
MIILGTMGEAERGLDAEDRDDFQEPLQILLENSNKRLVKRQNNGKNILVRTFIG